jgi:glycosyltransferase involved in cell wall biosynthesis
MKLLFLAKRRPQQRDLLDRPYGRFHYLPAGLASLGNEVRVILLGHHGQPSGEIDLAGVLWRHHDLRTLGPAKLDRTIGAEVAEFSPDWLVGCSDAWFGWLAHRWARRSGARLAIDAYDNFESYMPWNLPLHWAWRRALAKADLVSAAGPQLAELLSRHRAASSPAQVIPMAADPAFRPLDKAECRHTLGLPVDTPLVGYYGGWAKSRGTHILLPALRMMRQRLPLLQLVVSGRPPPEVAEEPGVVPLGYLDDASLPLLVNALDVALVITANSSFGKYSYPAKLCEAMACGTPVVATETEPVRWMLDNERRFLVDVGDAEALAIRTVALIHESRVEYRGCHTWESIASRFDQLLVSAGTSQH